MSQQSYFVTGALVCDDDQFRRIHEILALHDLLVISPPECEVVAGIGDGLSETDAMLCIEDAWDEIVKLGLIRRPATLMVTTGEYDRKTRVSVIDPTSEPPATYLEFSSYGAVN